MSAKKAPLMTEAEAECFRVARALQRKDIVDGLKSALLPALPLFHEAMKQNLFTRAVYVLIMLLGLPVILLFWLARLAFWLVIFPYRYYSTFFLPRGFTPPGERNIQGMHSAWSKYLHLSTRRYIQCLNLWAKILYGKQAVRANRLENYFDVSLLKYSDNGGQGAFHLRNSLRLAREEVSKKLGYY